MEKEKLFAVFGLGTFGYEVCRNLVEKGAKVIAIDHSEKILDKIKNDVAQAILIDSTDEEALHNSGVEDIDVAIVAIGDVDANILTTALLKKFGVPYIIARALSETHAQVLKQIGATEVINIEIEEGKRVATKLMAPEVLDVIPISQNQSLAEIRVPKEFVGKTLSRLDLRKKFNVNVISIKRIETVIDDMGNPIKEEIVINPQPTDVLQVNDILVLLGSDEAIESLKEL